MGFPDLITSIDRAVQTHLGGVDVLYTPQIGQAATVKGIFDERSRLLESGEAGVEVIVPSVVVRLEDLPTHPDDDEPTIQIEGIDYFVRQRETDGIGGSVRLYLRRVEL